MSEVKFADRTGEGSRRRGLALPFWIFMLIAAAAAAGAGLLLKQQEQGYLSAMATSEGERRVEMLISASLEDIISEDVPRLETTLEQVMENVPDIYLIRISDEDDKVLVEQRKADGSRSMAAAPRVGGDSTMQRLVKAVRFEGDTYGRMTVEWDPSRASAEAEKHAYMVASMAAIVCMLFGLLGYWFGRSRP